MGVLRWGRQVAGLKGVVGVPGRGNSQGKDPEVGIFSLEGTRHRQEAGEVRMRGGTTAWTGPGQGSWEPCRVLSPGGL